jgi:hypothetical protein
MSTPETTGFPSPPRIEPATPSETHGTLPCDPYEGGIYCLGMFFDEVIHEALTGV